MLGCDAVLLVRLLLEEQRLDRGSSNGRGGKYGGRFHPSALESSAGGRSNVGSRPLTVGELYENWRDLRDVARGRYPLVEVLANGTPTETDPLPKIRRCLSELYAARGDILPPWHPLAHDVLFEDRPRRNGAQRHVRKNTMLLLGHTAQLPWALTFLATLCPLEVESDVELPGRGDAKYAWTLSSKAELDNRKMKVVVTTPENVQHVMQQQGTDGGKERSNDDPQPPLLLVVPNSDNEQTQSNMIKRIVVSLNGHSEVKSNRDVFVVHSSLDVLQRCKVFLGDDAPILAQGRRRCILPQTGTTVTLFLPQWADNVHPTQQNDAEMDPWLNLVREEQLLEFVSGRLVRAPQ